MKPRVFLVATAVGTLVAACALGLAWLTGSPWLAFVLCIPLSAGIGWLAVQLTLRSSLRGVERLDEGLRRLGSRDYSVHIDPADTGALAELATSLNALGQVLREGHDTAEERERLMRMLIDSAPMAIVLLGDAGTIVYTNEAARDLFFEGRSLEGHNFLSMLGEAPAPFREALLGNEDSLFMVELDGEQETYHLAKRHFEIRDETHALIMVKHLTRELRRQEIDVWKKLIRVISHELNNSLAPITSLVHSARMITQDSEHAGRLTRVYSTIEERAAHLQQFIAGYAKFARLPKPRSEKVDLPSFVEHIKTLSPMTRIDHVPDGNGWFDRSQVEQVLINLLKNAEESSSPRDEIRMDISLHDNDLKVVVADRGSGMSEEVLQHALLPFYSTKERGTGLGLALCREIVEAHGGRIRIQNRDGGGVEVTFTLPGPEPISPSSKAKLTMSRV
ncbi:MAG: ATP-binding protein [Deltaproteobacteria bacterium]|nr:ATP-binding protein [Deltaproteobacteria bacterium]